MENATSKLSLDKLSNFILPIAFVAEVIIFSFASDSFFSAQNFYNVVANKVVLLAIVSLGMTIVIAAGGIDLSVGVSVDLSALTFFTILAAGYGALFGIAGGLVAACLVGCFNALLINKLQINAIVICINFIDNSIHECSLRAQPPHTSLIVNANTATRKTV